MKAFIEGLNLETIMNSGQVFSINVYSAMGENWYEITSANHYCFGQQTDKGIYLISSENDGQYWIDYFNLDGLKYLDNLKNDPNEFIRICYEYSHGLTMLRQDLWQTIISFIMSQQRNIPCIKSTLTKFKERFGKKQKIGNYEFISFPTARQLKKITVDDLQGLGLGYRDKYIINAIKWYNETDINEFLQMSAEQQIEELKTIKGIGDKVANCISLFALNNFSAFPIDVWIKRVMSANLISNEDIKRWGDKAGLVQQVIFYYVLNHKAEIKKLANEDSSDDSSSEY